MDMYFHELSQRLLNVPLISCCSTLAQRLFNSAGATLLVLRSIPNYARFDVERRSSQMPTGREKILSPSYINFFILANLAPGIGQVILTDTECTIPHLNSQLMSQIAHFISRVRHIITYGNHIGIGGRVIRQQQRFLFQRRLSRELDRPRPSTLLSEVRRKLYTMMLSVQVS